MYDIFSNESEQGTGQYKFVWVYLWLRLGASGSTAIPNQLSFLVRRSFHTTMH